MTEKELDSIFQKHDDEFLHFDRVQEKRSSRPDIHAFLLLNEIMPANCDMIGAARHDEIFLDVDVAGLAQVISEGQVVELVRAGVRLSEGSLCMFV